MTEPEQPLSRRALREAQAAGGATAATPATTPITSIPDDGEAASGDAERSGIGAFATRRSRALLATALSIGFLLATTGSLFAGVSVGSASTVAPVPVVTVTPTPTPDPRAVPATLAEPSRLRTCTIDAIARDERLTTLFGSVVNATTGERLWDRQAATPARTASVLKILTGAVLLSALGPDYRLTTRVVAGSTPGSVVIIGGGDPTLSRLPTGQESVYRGAPKLADLAAQTVAAYAAANPDAPGITEIVLDASYWSTADRWDSSWSRELQTIGYASEVTALQVDGDRNDPRAEISPRSTDPLSRVGAAFASALANAGNPAGEPTWSVGTASGGAALGQVQSQPVSSLVAYIVDSSDNTLAEVLSRVASRVIGLDGSAASLTPLFLRQLATFGVPTTGIAIRDASGLSSSNAIPAQYVADLLVLVHGGGQNLSVVRDALSVAGVNGNLATRFTGANAIARGAVQGKVGWIGTARTIAGIVRAADGTVLTFSFYAIRENVSANTRDALDSLTTGVFTCGDNLSNN